MRLNAWLARAAVASRRGADELIKSGRVMVNSRPGRLDDSVGPSDRVEVDGRLVVPERLRYLLLYKPRGVVTTMKDPEGRPNVGELTGVPERVVPVGRLDLMTSGALLLTNDGELAHRLMHPSFEIEKTYEAEVVGAPSDDVLKRLGQGIELEDGLTAPARIRRVAPSRIELSIHEGRNRQVRRMLKHVGHPVRRLHRSRYAGLTLDGMKPGEWRELSEAELARLKQTN